MKKLIILFLIFLSSMAQAQSCTPPYPSFQAIAWASGGGCVTKQFYMGTDDYVDLYYYQHHCTSDSCLPQFDGKVVEVDAFLEFDSSKISYLSVSAGSNLPSNWSIQSSTCGSRRLIRPYGPPLSGNGWFHLARVWFHPEGIGNTWVNFSTDIPCHTRAILQDPSQSGCNTTILLGMENYCEALDFSMPLYIVVQSRHGGGGELD